MDDYPDDETTTGRLELGMPLTGILGLVDSGVSSNINRESDWFRVSLVANESYDFIGFAEFDRARMSIVDPANGIVQSSRDLQNLNQHRDSKVFTPAETRDYFVEISNSLGIYSGYTVVANPYEIPESEFTRIDLKNRTSFAESIEQPFDRDFFRVAVNQGWTYQFELRGIDSGSGSLADPNLRIYDSNRTLLATQNDGGMGRDSSMQFVASDSGDLYLSAAGLGANDGTYEVEFKIIDYLDDAALGPATTSRLPLGIGQNPVMVRTLEIPGDIDWHKVDMFAGQWYQLGYQARDVESLMFLRDPNNEIVESTVLTGRNGYFYVKAQQTGTHHLIFRNGSRDYTIYGVANTAPPITSREVSYSLLDEETVTANQLVSLNQFPAESIQVVSEADFVVGSVQYDRFVQHSFPADQLADITFSGLVGQEFDVSFRAVENQIASGWVQTAISSRVSSGSILDIDQLWNEANTQRDGENTISFRFADTIPSYFQPGRFSGFQKVSPAVEDAIESILYPGNGIALPRYVDLKFVYDETEEADIQIFTADSDELAIGFAPGKFGFGDIVLDNEVYAGNAAPEPGSEAFLKLVRAIATSLGVKHFAPELNIEQSVVGISGTHDASRPLPRSFGTWDINYLQSVYGEPQDTSSNYLRPKLGVRSSGEFNTTILRAQNGEIQARDSEFPVSIDLRESEVSRLRTDEIWQSYTIGLGVKINHGIGSDFDDEMTGNHRRNSLYGGFGNDILRGLGGDDSLTGGLGNDTYVYETGDGNDMIHDRSNVSENDAGIDTLQITGKFGMDRVEEDLTFRLKRQLYGINAGQNDLIIDLDMNGEYNRNNGSITIRNIDDLRHQVERLDLRNFSTELGVYSLVSVWANATHEKQRFAPTGGSDAFGLTLSPIG